MEINNYDYISDLYDTYVPATFDIEFFIKETKKSSGEVLELMSGTGRVSVPLLQAGVKLTCVDLSAELNAVFRRKLEQMKLKADIYRMDIRQLEIPKKFGMIIIPFHSFAHIVSADDQRKTLRRIQRHLLPGGIFICTLGNPARRQKWIDGQLRLFGKYPLPGEQGTLLLWIMENYNSEDHQIVEASQFYEEYDAKGVLKSKRLLELHFRLSSKEEFEKLAIDAGFKVKALYGDYAYAEFTQQSSPFMIWLLESAS
jgi:SAM-dependent methyltransferase